MPRIPKTTSPTHFYIMRAHHLAETPRKISLKKILAEEPDCTIVVGLRHRIDKKVPIFLIGSQGDYNVKAGDVATYTLDTGNGYRERDKAFEVEGVVHVKGGVIQGKADVEGLTARHTFVMK